MMRTAILSISLVALFTLPPSSAGQQSADRLSFAFRDIPLNVALDSLMRRTPVPIVYLDRMVEGKRVTASCDKCTFAAALDAVLNGTSLTWVVIGNQVILQELPMPALPATGTIAGVVSDSYSGELLGGANVVLEITGGTDSASAVRWCPTNTGGFYSLRKIPPGDYRITVRNVGYRILHIPVTVAPHEAVRRDVALSQENVMLPEVSVEGERSPLASAGTFARGLYIPSTPSDPTQYYLDGVRIYNPSHYGGVLSTFNPEALTDVEVLIGGLSPAYGGRIGGILDYALRDGTTAALGGSAGSGSLGSTIALEGPLSSATTFLISGRRGYPDVLVPALRNEGTPSRLGSTELVAKASHRFSPNNRLSINAYWGEDDYSNLVEVPGIRLSNTFSWGNRALNLRWTGILTPSVFAQAAGSYSRYTIGLGHELSSAGQPAPGASPSSAYMVEDIGIRAQVEHYFDPEHTILGGMDIEHHRFAGTLSALSTQIGTMTLDGVSSWEISVYLQDQWQILPRVVASMGARAATFSGARGAFSSIDPRFSLQVSLSDQTRLSMAFSAVNQFMHPYRSSGVFLLTPAVFWYPSTETMRPSSSVRLTVGLQHRSRDNIYEVVAEPFYRVTNTKHEFVFTTVSGPIEDALRMGTGTSYGVQAILRKRTGDVTGMLMYSLSWGEERFPDIQDGRPYAPRFGRRHEVQAEIWYAPLAEWVFGMVGVIGSDLSPSLDPFQSMENTGPRIGEYGQKSGLDLNGGRLPGFQRLEIHVLHHFALGGLSCTAALRLLNAYGLLDPFIWTPHESDDPRLTWSARMRKLQLFPLFPTLGITVRF